MERNANEADQGDVRVSAKALQRGDIQEWHYASIIVPFIQNPTLLALKDTLTLAATVPSILPLDPSSLRALSLFFVVPLCELYAPSSVLTIIFPPPIQLLFPFPSPPLSLSPRCSPRRSPRHNTHPVFRPLCLTALHFLNHPNHQPASPSIISRGAYLLPSSLVIFTTFPSRGPSAACSKQKRGWKTSFAKTPPYPMLLNLLSLRWGATSRGGKGLSHPTRICHIHLHPHEEGGGVPVFHSRSRFRRGGRGFFIFF